MSDLKSIIAITFQVCDATACVLWERREKFSGVQQQAVSHCTVHTFM